MMKMNYFFMYKKSKFRTYNKTTLNNQRFKGKGNFSSQNRQTGGRIKTMSFKNPDIFIKKAKAEEINTEYTPRNSFEAFNIPQVLKDNILNKGYSVPTPIQDQAIIPMLEGRDLIGIANTGTGKTAAFLIPIVNKIFRDRSRQALIVTPTRELATQIYEELKSFTQNIKVYSSLVIGGANMRRQVYEVKKGPNIIVGTPGRIKDLISQRVLFLEDFDTVVLDEVDLMVDIGFLQDVKYFISLLPKERQSLFFSATVNPKVSQILQSFVKNPVTVSVKIQDTPSNIDQDVVRVLNPAKKLDQLHDLLISEGFDKVLIFGRTKHGIEKLNRDLLLRGFKVGAIHGNKSQGYRQRTLNSFKQDQIQILLATDVASRGLDIPNVSHVINYELPQSYEDYIHRIGRTGRASNKGKALTFIN